MEWQEEAELTLRGKEEGLAWAALIEKQELTDLITQLDHEMQLVNRTLTRMKRETSGLRNEPNETYTHQ